MSFVEAQADGATILGEREYMFQDGKKVLADKFARVGSGKDTVYGRSSSIFRTTKDGARACSILPRASLLRLKVLCFRPNGNSASASRLVDCIAFTLSPPRSRTSSNFRLPSSNNGQQVIVKQGDGMNAAEAAFSSC
jgi:hypothetical protein